MGEPHERLELMLEQAYRDTGWARRLQSADNPFGRGDSGARIVEAIAAVLGIPRGVATGAEGDVAGGRRPSNPGSCRR